MAALIGGGVLYALYLGRKRRSASHDRSRRDAATQRQLPAPPAAVHSTGKRDQEQSRRTEPNVDLYQPRPLGISNVAIEEAQLRAAQHMYRCTNARNRRDYPQARQALALAITEVQSKLRIDHWYTADVLNMAGCIEYDEGFYVKAREYWEVANNVACEWPDRCADIRPTIEKNLQLVKGTLGF
jgi:hypothetical protein